MKTWLTKIHHYLQKPYPFYANDLRYNFALVVGCTVFCAVFMSFFQLRGAWFTDEETTRLMVGSVITFFVLCFDILVLPLLYPIYFENNQFTRLRYILHNLLHLFLITFGMYLYDVYLTGSWLNCLYKLPIIFLKVSIFGIIPILLVTIVSQNITLYQNLRKAKIANEDIFKRQHQKLNKITPLTIQSETKEELKIFLDQFLFAEADDNYSVVYWQETEKVNQKLLRITLKNLQQQLSHQHIVRCHRSYLVNLDKVQAVNGNSNGFELSLDGTSLEVPVSRNMSKSVLSLIAEVPA